VASRSNRQRKLERARVERRMARQAQRTRRKRQAQAGVGAGLALILIVLGTTWLLGGFSSSEANPAASAGSCVWTEKSAAANPGVKQTGTPPSGELRSGFETMTITTNQGPINVLMDLSKTPCTAASFAFLGQQNFFSGSHCHRLNTEAKTLTCGDPNSDGTGGPSYQFANEDLPTTPIAPPGSPDVTASASPGATYYAKGTVVLVNTGADTNGSQFTIVYGDGSTLSPAYSVVGTVTSGLDIVEKVAQGGAANDGKTAVEGKPVIDLTIQQLVVNTPAGESATPTAQSPSAPATPGATTSP